MSGPPKRAPSLRPTSESPPAGPPAPFTLGHRPFLDGLRGCALLMVVSFHVLGAVVMRGGHVGVDLFFVLSGFLITALLVQEHGRTGAISLWRFYLRRALRLLPPVACLLAACWLAALAFGSREFLRSLGADTPWVVLYCYNWRLWATPAVPHPAPIEPLWSLAVEEQFYLVWPAALAVLLRLRVRRRWVVGLTALGVVLAAAERAVLWARNDCVYVRTDTRSDALLLGCLVGLLVSWTRGPATSRGRRLLGAAGWLGAAVFLAFALAAGPWRETGACAVFLYGCGGYSLLYACAAVFLASLFWAPPALLMRALNSRALRWIGRISYSAYLWQVPLYCALLYCTNGQHLRLVVAPTFAACLAAGALSHYAIERPFQRLKDRLCGGAARPASGALPARRAA